MIRVRQIRVSFEQNTEAEIKKRISKKLWIPKEAILSYRISKKSIDARKKPDIMICYEADVYVKDEDKVLSKTRSNDVLKVVEEDYECKVTGNKAMKHRPVIVGSGPAGLFAAYLLAEKGYAPIVIERGEAVEKRVQTVESFWETGLLNKESNVQFGEGGAGTFSDGKLNTLVKDKEGRGKKVFETFVKHGASEDILYENKPHIGTDVLREVVKGMREEIIKNSGEFHYETCLSDIKIENDKVKAIEINQEKWIDTDTLVLAVGHSARDTFAMLYEKGIQMEAKPFAVGIRIQHPQSMINVSQYGYKNHPLLPKASYKLTYTASNHRGVYSFCMCPGGYVVNASSEEGMLAINGMSNHARESENANSAVVVTVSPKDFGEHPLDGIAFQRELEEKTYKLGNGKIPVQLWKDFKENKKSTSFGKVNPIMKGSYTLSDLNTIYPKYMTDALKEAIPYFEHKIKGYSMEDALLAGTESRTSSPLRIVRDDDGLSNIGGIYPCGEGSGYAGGITTSAMDGIKAAEHIASIYTNQK
ncbi:MAG: NAD(P)-binding protein [Bacilli bacterium]|nr:NAD(P)-binding protein [Bacilli bacterium]